MEERLQRQPAEDILHQRQRDRVQVQRHGAEAQRGVLRGGTESHCGIDKCYGVERNENNRNKFLVQPKGKLYESTDMYTINSKHIGLLFFLMLTLSTISLRAQDMAVGSNIVSRTLLSSDGTRNLVQRVHDNGLGDVVQEAQYYPGTTLPSVVVHHEYDDYRRRTRSWLPVVSSDSVFISGNVIAYMAQSQIVEKTKD